MTFYKYLGVCLGVLCSALISAQQYATVTSTEGWSVTVTMQYKQARITSNGNKCRDGFTYEIDMDYTVSYDDEGGARMYWLGAGEGCFTEGGAVTIPESSAMTGTLSSPTKWADPQPGDDKCRDIDMSRFECNTVFLTLQGPGIPQQTVEMQSYQSTPDDGSAPPPGGGGGSSDGNIGTAPGGGEFQLPITLMDFSAAVNGNGVDLRWETAQEESNEYFVIEYSSDADYWEVLDTVSGAGNTQLATTYSLHDYNSHDGTTYYRLIQVDFSGEVHTFPVIAVSAEQALAPLQAYPNPVSDRLYVRTGGKVEIFDLRGQRLTATLPIVDRGGDEYEVDVSRLNQGIYVLRAGDELLRFVRQ